MTHTLLSKHSHACPRTHTQATFVCHSTSRCHTRWRRQAVGDWDGRLANQPHIDLMQQDVTHSADHPKSLPGSERAPTGLKALLQLCTSTSLSIPSCFIFPFPVYKNVPLKTALILLFALSWISGSSQCQCSHFSLIKISAKLHQKYLTGVM